MTDKAIVVTLLDAEGAGVLMENAKHRLLCEPYDAACTFPRCSCGPKVSAISAIKPSYSVQVDPKLKKK